MNAKRFMQLTVICALSCSSLLSEEETTQDFTNKAEQIVEAATAENPAPVPPQ